MAQAADVRSYTLDEIIDLMMEKGTTLTRADVAATLQVYGEVVSAIIKDGSAVNTPLMNTSMSISGVFDGANDSFDKKRHTVNLNIRSISATVSATGSVNPVEMVDVGTQVSGTIKEIYVD